MSRLTLCCGKWQRRFLFSDERSGTLLPSLAFSLLFGILFGTVFGVFSDSLPATLNSSALFSEFVSSGGTVSVAWRALRYILAAVVLSTGYLGVFLIPVLTAFRGFSYACTVAALFSRDGFSGLLFGAFSVGVPAMAELFSFLYVGGYCMHASFALLPGRRNEIRKRPSLRDAAIILLLCIADVLYCIFLMPIFCGRLL